MEPAADEAKSVFKRDLNGRAAERTDHDAAELTPLTIEKSIEEHIPAWFAGRILPLTQSIAERWGVLEGQRQLMGRPLSVPDGQIAATALEHSLVVATRNVKDFVGLGVSVINPWEE